MMLTALVDEPVFGISLTFAAYYAGILISRRTKSLFFHPILVALVGITAFLVVTGIDYESYNRGGGYITFLLAPATVALAIPMYRQLPLLRRNMGLILGGILFGSTFGVLIVFFLGYLVGTGGMLLVSMIPKAVTTPIAVGISAEIGGEPSLTAAMVIVNGLLGAMFGPELLDLFRVRTRLARGLAMGISSHGLGTARALQENEVEGALSGLAIGLMGLFTAMVAPLSLFFLL